jgi:homocysteine S-methyltransferase
MTNTGETLGILRAAKQAGLPALVSPTIEPDGTLPDGTRLDHYITRVDEATAGQPVAYMVNCAHPAHIEPHLAAAAAGGDAWLSRFRGLRANASTKTHAELDNSTELDRGDISRLARDMGALASRYQLTIYGGCCGTDAEHLQRIAAACAPQRT